MIILLDILILLVTGALLISICQPSFAESGFIVNGIWHRKAFPFKQMALGVLILGLDREANR